MFDAAGCSAPGAPRGRRPVATGHVASVGMHDWLVASWMTPDGTGMLQPIEDSSMEGYDAITTGLAENVDDPEEIAQVLAKRIGKLEADLG